MNAPVPLLCGCGAEFEAPTPLLPVVACTACGRRWRGEAEETPRRLAAQVRGLAMLVERAGRAGRATTLLYASARELEETLNG